MGNLQPNQNLIREILVVGKESVKIVELLSVRVYLSEIQPDFVEGFRMRTISASSEPGHRQIAPVAIGEPDIASPGKNVIAAPNLNACAVSRETIVVRSLFGLVQKVDLHRQG